MYHVCEDSTDWLKTHETAGDLYLVQNSIWPGVDYFFGEWSQLLEL